MDRNNPAPVKTADIIKKIEDHLSSLQKLAQQPAPTNTLVDKLALETKGLQTEIDRLSARIRPHFKILKDIHQDAYANHHLRGKSMDGETRMELLLCWSYIIEGILTDFTLLTTYTPVISSVSSILRVILPSFLKPPPPIPGNKQTRTASQKRLNAVFESTISSSKTLSFSIAKLKDNLFDLATTTIPYASSAAAKDFTNTLTHNHHAPRASFFVALQSTRKLIRLVVKMLLLGPEGGTEMNRYSSKINILLRVLENYFYRHPARRRYDLFGSLEPERARGGFPVTHTNMFQVEETGGILSGLVGTCIVLKVGAAKTGFNIRALGAVEGRMKMLKRCLEIMWERELAFINKVEWMRSPQRVVRKVKRKADKTEEEEKDAAPRVAPKSADRETHTTKERQEASANAPMKRECDPGTGKIPTGKNGSKTSAPNDEEATAANVAFGTGKVPTTAGKKGTERMGDKSTATSTPTRVESNTGLGAEGKKKRKKGGRKHGGGRNN